MTQQIYLNRTYKDMLFDKVFSDKASILALYNAVAQTEYHDASAISVNTIERAIFFGIENDKSFIIDEYRQFIYENKLDIYGKKQVVLPNPIYLVFYNGEDKQPERQIIHLQEAFPQNYSTCNDFLDFKTVMLNINYGYNKDLMERCRPLKEYAIFVDTIRKYLKTENETAIAAKKAVEECIKQGILKDILIKEKGVIEDMITVCYDEEVHKMREAEYNQELGEERGKLNIAKKMYASGMSINQIHDITEIDKQELKKLLI